MVTTAQLWGLRGVRGIRAQLWVVGVDVIRGLGNYGSIVGVEVIWGWETVIEFWGLRG